SAWYRFRKFVRRNKVAFAMTTVAALALIALAVAGIRASRQIREHPPQLPVGFREWYFKYLDYSCGLIASAELLEAARPSRPNRCEAHFAIGLRRLAEGDRTGAKEHFRECAETKVFIYWDHKWARAFLARMEAEPAWPPWIPLKK